MKDYSNSEWFVCPVCGSEISYEDAVYISENNEVLGCRTCIMEASPALWCAEAQDDNMEALMRYERYRAEREEAYMRRRLKCALIRESTL